jgi:hypothetical protein
MKQYNLSDNNTLYSITVGGKHYILFGQSRQEHKG